MRAAMEQLDEPEELRCWRVWCRKWSELPKDWKTREKMIRYLSYRGFGMGAIQKVLRGEVELPEENADGDPDDLSGFRRCTESPNEHTADHAGACKDQPQDP